MSKKLKSLLSKIEKKLEFKPTRYLAYAVLAFIALSVVDSRVKKNDTTASSVMITDMSTNRGGTGVILESNGTRSKILTNSHVCRVVENGGLVIGKNGTFLVTTYKHSNLHDICMITVSGDMGYSTKVADSPPTSYYESATISGHPALMPNVISSGHFSGRKVIQVMTGMRKCTDEDLKDPGKAFVCMLANGYPEVKRYESTLVTATIMPGSSGSGVYNENKELSGLAFAGSQGFGYAWTVPYEALKYFVDKEQFVIEESKPNSLVEISLDEGESKRKSDEFDAIKKIGRVCLTDDADKIKEVCEVVSRNMIWIK